MNFWASGATLLGLALAAYVILEAPSEPSTKHSVLMVTGIVLFTMGISHI